MGDLTLPKGSLLVTDVIYRFYPKIAVLCPLQTTPPNDCSEKTEFSSYPETANGTIRGLLLCVHWTTAVSFIPFCNILYHNPYEVNDVPARDGSHIKKHARGPHAPPFRSEGGGYRGERVIMIRLKQLLRSTRLSPNHPSGIRCMWVSVWPIEKAESWGYLAGNLKEATALVVDTLIKDRATVAIVCSKNILFIHM